ncbi:MFS transporter [Rhizobium alvei]|uniref:MFS transporter n=1 Tax=Rhizobium alvei TaxID=1132659 RepID=A0ABT8YQT2_9HYPH|nr:MFS transporter [Rhizobium alvei]MDO6965634.1 MFS transporter [Rhizobium alvei]
MSAPHPMAQAAQQPPAPYANRWIAMFVLLMASFMNMIDVTIVNVALPSLQKGLQATESAIEWIVAGYIMAFALGLLPFGRYGDIAGKKRMFLIGVASFTIASALCGLAVNVEMLIVARIIQGIAGAIMTPQVLAIAQTMFPANERAQAFSLFGLTAGLASVAGPVTGGFLIDANLFGLEWRPIFLINIPIGIAAVIAGRRLIPDIKGNPSLSNDWVGIGIAALAIFCLIFPLVEGRGFGWPVWCFAMMLAFLPLAIAFVLWERRQKSVGGAELLPTALMANSNYLFGAAATMVFFSAMPGYFLVLAVFLQGGYNLSPLQSGLTTLGFPVGVLLASAITGRLGGRYPRQRMVFGAAMLIGSILLLRHIVSGIGEEIIKSDFILPMIIGGIGTGFAIAPMFQMVLASVPPKDTGSGSGALQAIQQMGGAFGVAIISEIFFSGIGRNLATGLSQHEAFKTALETSLWYNIACYVIVAGSVLFLKASQSAGIQHAAPPME